MTPPSGSGAPRDDGAPPPCSVDDMVAVLRGVRQTRFLERIEWQTLDWVIAHLSSLIADSARLDSLDELGWVSHRSDSLREAIDAAAAAIEAAIVVRATPHGSE